MKKIYDAGGTTVQLRSKAEVARFFDGLELLEPGVTAAHEWRPEQDAELSAGGGRGAPQRHALLGGGQEAMNVPWARANSGGGRRPTEHQLQMARVRARTTGESVAHVLSVFMGAGRHGPAASAGATGPEAPLTGEPEAWEGTESPSPSHP